MRMIGAALLLVMGLGAAGAQEVPVVTAIRDGAARPIADRPTGRAVATFLDVLRLAYPDLGADGRASQRAGAPAVPDAVAGGDQPAGPAEIDLTAGSGASFAVLTEGERDHVAVMVSGVLVVAQVAPEFRPAGALLVRTDPAGEPAIAQMLLLGEGRPGVVVMNGHANPQEWVAQHLIATPIEGQLRQVFQGPVLYSQEGRERGCEPRRLEQRLLPIALRDARREGYADLEVTVRAARICTLRGRARTLGATIHHARLRWDPAQGRYLGGLDALDRRNRERMGAARP